KVGFSLETALKKGPEFLPEAAKIAADDLVRKTQFRYGKIDLPLILRDPKIGTAFQFASFSIKSTELMFKWLVREGAAGKTKFFTFLSMGLGISTLAGALGFPTLGDGLASPV
ncbi:MAG: hypothetical protein J3T61_12060, partial [Candidatus Brocadiales bacterium]|nr:hypothetical protein [Candidatus Bathyanammoxibius sp.]